MIKQDTDCLSSHVTLLVNKCISEATFPELLKRAEVTAKKSNYRPISVPPCFSLKHSKVLL